VIPKSVLNNVGHNIDIRPLSSSPIHTSESFAGKEHLTVEAYDGEDSLVKILHITPDGNDGEILVPSERSLEKR